MAVGGGLFDEITRIDKSSLSVSTGIRAALQTITPLVLGLAIGQP